MNVIGTDYAGIDLILYGVIVVVVILFMPHGIVGWLEELWEKKGKGG